MKEDEEYQNAGKLFNPIGKKSKNVEFDSLKKINYFRDMYIDKLNARRFKRMQLKKQGHVHTVFSDDSSAKSQFGGDPEVMNGKNVYKQASGLNEIL